MTNTPIPQMPAAAISALIADPIHGDDAMMDYLSILCDMDEIMTAESPFQTAIRAIFNLLSDDEKRETRIDFDICPTHCQDIDICLDDLPEIPCADAEEYQNS